MEHKSPWNKRILISLCYESPAQYPKSVWKLTVNTSMRSTVKQGHALHPRTWRNYSNTIINLIIWDVTITDSLRSCTTVRQTDTSVSYWFMKCKGHGQRNFLKANDVTTKYIWDKNNTKQMLSWLKKKKVCSPKITFSQYLLCLIT